MTAPTPLYEITEQRLGTDLFQFMASRRAQNPPMAWDTIAIELYIATGHKARVTGVTLKGWHDRIVANGEAVA